MLCDLQEALSLTDRNIGSPRYRQTQKYTGVKPFTKASWPKKKGNEMLLTYNLLSEMVAVAG